MHNNFRKIDGTEIENISKYINDYIDKTIGEYRLYIGTDSQRVKGISTVMYATVICIHRLGKGAHVIYRKTKRNNIKDLFNKLWWEVEDSLGVALELKNGGVFLHSDLLSVHLDFSPNKKDGSNIVYESALGYVKSYGFDVQMKPESPIASHCADCFVRL